MAFSALHTQLQTPIAALGKTLQEDFPTFAALAKQKPLVYLDNAATTLKPQKVLDALSYAYVHLAANVHRSVHHLSAKATQAYQQSRLRVQHFLGAAHGHEIIFVRGTTEAINLVASSYGRTFLKQSDIILISAMEHHANIVPWQMVAQQTGAVIKVIPIHENGTLDLQAFSALLSDGASIVAINHVSNALGTVNPIAQICEMAHNVGAVVMVDGAQAVAHGPVDVQALGADFYAFSGHKVYGPQGIGVLYGKTELLEKMPPYQGGGDMIEVVSYQTSTYNRLPHKLEAGTPHVSGAVALAAALDYLTALDFTAIAQHEQALLQYALTSLQSLEGLRLIGQAPDRAGVISFVIEGVHPHDIGTIADTYGVAVRTGHHCAQPLMDHYGLAATVRASFAPYNTFEDVDAMMQALQRASHLFKRS